MSNLLSQLENNEAVLMLYLAGELPQEDCIEVQRMLERDTALRAQCIAMDRLVNRAALSFGMDTALAAAAPTERARERLSPIFRQWTAQRLSQPAQAPQVIAAGHTPWFLYPLAAAAIILVAVAILWSSIEPDYRAAATAGRELAYLPNWTELDDSPADVATPETSREADTLIATFDESRQQNDSGSSGLVFAATELTRLQELDGQADTSQPSVQYHW